jgi:hypothetical protein
MTKLRVFSYQTIWRRNRLFAPPHELAQNFWLIRDVRMRRVSHSGCYENMGETASSRPLHIPHRKLAWIIAPVSSLIIISPDDES